MRLEVVDSGENLAVMAFAPGRRLNTGTAGLDLFPGMWGGRYWFARLLVREQWRGKGVGSAILRRVQEHCTARQLGIYCLPNPYGDGSMEALVRFYDRHGFQAQADGALVWDPVPGPVAV